VIEGLSVDDITLLDGKPDQNLGNSPEASFTEHSGVMKEGYTAILYTDGIIESRNPDDDEFGEGRLTRTILKIADPTPRNILEKMMERLGNFCQGRAADDDITMVVINRAI
jgi:sigma-B regulation protein RsbU (phosphoserine phosphatase)